jgi:hypothetical protein
MSWQHESLAARMEGPEPPAIRIGTTFSKQSRGIWLVVRPIPADVMSEYRSIASAVVDRPSNKIAAAVIIVMWIAGGGACLLAACSGRGLSGLACLFVPFVKSQAR